MTRRCCRCNAPWDRATDNLRPYGPDGQDICFTCARATPELRAETDLRMHAAFDAASLRGSVVIAVGGIRSLDECEPSDEIAAIFPPFKTKEQS